MATSQGMETVNLGCKNPKNETPDCKTPDHNNLGNNNWFLKYFPLCRPSSRVVNPMNDKLHVFS